MKQIKNLIIAILLAVCVLGCSTRATSVADLYSKFESKGHSMKLGGPYSGVILVAGGDSIIHHGAYGYTDWEKEVRINKNDEFPLGSVSNQFTSMLVMILQEEGLLNLDSPISKYLPQLMNKRLSEVTLHHLLSHTSGLPHYEGLVSLGYDYRTYATTSYTPSELVAMIDQCSMRYEPGNGVYYSSLGYLLAGAILEEVSGQTFDGLLTQYITAPLGMTKTGFKDNDYAKQNLVNGFNYEESYGLDWWQSEFGGEISPTSFRDQSGKHAAGGIHSTALDLWKWSQAIRERKLISSESYNRMLKPVGNGFAYGWISNYNDLIERNKDVQMIMHSGALPGYRASIALYEDGITVISLANIQPIKDRSLLHQTYEVAKGIEVKNGLEGYPEWSSVVEFEDAGGFKALNSYFDKLSRLCGYEVAPSASSLLRIAFKYADNKDVGTADSLIASTLNTQEVESSLVNQMGYRFLEEGFYDQSKLLFAYNIKKDSLSANAWDSMGDAYRASGDKLAARNHYQKAVDRARAVGSKNLEAFVEHLKATD